MGSESIKIDFTFIGDGYVLIFDEQKNKLVFVDSDTFLSKTVKDNFIPQDFIDKLDKDLDNKINVDPGEF
jgi:hypothetical protein